MKKRFFKTAIPLLLLAFVILFIGSGCWADGDADGDYWFLDNDNDGYGDSAHSIFQDGQPTGYVLDDTDCDDNNDLIHPGATEIAEENRIDENCDGLISLIRYEDKDEDGFGFGNPVVIEMAIDGDYGNKYATNNADCDDTNPDINILADEIMGNDIDDNCNGLIDAKDIRYIDEDGDGYGSQNEAAADGVFNNLDCDDMDASIHPYAVDTPNDGVDKDCDGID